MTGSRALVSVSCRFCKLPTHNMNLHDSALTPLHGPESETSSDPAPLDAPAIISPLDSPSSVATSATPLLHSPPNIITPATPPQSSSVSQPLESPASETRSTAAALHEILGCCLGNMDLLDIVHITTSSKAVALACKSHLSTGNKQLAHKLLRAAINEALEPDPTKAQLATVLSRMEHAYQQRPAPFTAKVLRSMPCSRSRQYTKAIQWLVTTSRCGELLSQEDPASTTTVMLVINTPNIPCHLAQTLTTAGMRVSYEQLMEAVCDDVEGVLVWPQASFSLGLQSEFPPWLDPSSFCWEVPGVSAAMQIYEEGVSCSSSHT